MLALKYFEVAFCVKRKVFFKYKRKVFMTIIT